MLLLSSCGVPSGSLQSFGPTICSLEARAGVILDLSRFTVLEREGAIVQLTDGEYSEDLSTVLSFDGRYPGAYERPGRYDVYIELSDGTLFTDTVEVVSDGCHVQTQYLVY